MKRTEGPENTSYAACPCGAEPRRYAGSQDTYLPWGAFRAKKKYLGGCWYIACTACGRVGKHAPSEKAAWARWEEAVRAYADIQKDNALLKRSKRYRESSGVKTRSPNEGFLYGPVSDEA